MLPYLVHHVRSNSYIHESSKVLNTSLCSEPQIFSISFLCLSALLHVVRLADLEDIVMTAA